MPAFDAPPALAFAGWPLPLSRPSPRPGFVDVVGLGAERARAASCALDEVTAGGAAVVGAGSRRERVVDRAVVVVDVGAGTGAARVVQVDTGEGAAGRVSGAGVVVAVVAGAALRRGAALEVEALLDVVPESSVVSRLEEESGDGGAGVSGGAAAVGARLPPKTCAAAVAPRIRPSPPAARRAQSGIRAGRGWRWRPDTTSRLAQPGRVPRPELRGDLSATSR